MVTKLSGPDPLRSRAAEVEGLAGDKSSRVPVVSSEVLEVMDCLLEEGEVVLNSLFEGLLKAEPGLAGVVEPGPGRTGGGGL